MPQPARRRVLAPHSPIFGCQKWGLPPLLGDEAPGRLSVQRLGLCPAIPSPVGQLARLTRRVSNW